MLPRTVQDILATPDAFVEYDTVTAPEPAGPSLQENTKGGDKAISDENPPSVIRLAYLSFKVRLNVVVAETMA